MKKQIITLTILLCTSLSAWAQKEYKLAKSSGKLILNLNGATVEGYDGKEIIFSSKVETDAEKDKRAQGLNAISSSGIIDNTGLGINVTENGQDVNVNLVGNGRDIRDMKILVPQQMGILFSYDNAMFRESVVISNMKGEIEVSVRYNEIKLVNNSGPMNIKSMHGGIDASFTEPIKGPISIISVYSYVDVALPTTTKANIELGTDYGKLYTAGDFKIAIAPEDKAAKEKNEAVAIALSGSGRTSSSFSSSNSRTVTIVDGKVVHSDSSGTLAVPPTPPTARGSRVLTVVGDAAAFGPGNREKIKGTINGGGIDFILKSNHNNIYLRTAN